MKKPPPDPHTKANPTENAMPHHGRSEGNPIANWAANAAIEWLAPDGLESRIERILAVDRPHDRALVIHLRKYGMPYLRACTEIDAAIWAKTAILLANDPWIRLPPIQENDKHSARREKSWQIIKDIVSLDPFDTAARAAAIKAAATGKTSIPRVYRLLYHYWQGGQTPHALEPRYERCGARGKPRTNAKKPGPKKRIENIPGKELTEADIRNMEAGYRLFFMRKGGPGLRAAYRRTIERFYHDGYEAGPCGRRIETLVPPDQRPSFRQFCYHNAKRQNRADVLRKRVGEKEFNLKHRSLTGIRDLQGPGALFEIDVTEGDIYLVSSLDPARVIGRPTVILVSDGFGRLITGVHATLEPESSYTLAIAIENMARDKVEFCREFGIEITPEEWPSHHLPERLLIDRGPLRATKGDPIVSGLNIDLLMAPPRRGDLKGVVERKFGIINTDLIHRLPGCVRKDRTSGDPRPEDSARLTLREFTRLVILWVLARNKAVIEKCDLRYDVGNVTPTSLALWTWGITHLRGALRTMQHELVRIALLPQSTATISREGIAFKGSYYTCKTAVEQQWFVGAKGVTYPCHYDPRDASRIFLRHQDETSQFQECQVIDPDSLAGHHLSWEEIDREQLARREREAAATRAGEPAWAALNAEIEHIPVASGKRNTKNMREARREEILRERLAANHHAPESTGKIVQMPGAHSPPASATAKRDARYLDMIRSRLR